MLDWVHEMMVTTSGAGGSNESPCFKSLPKQPSRGIPLWFCLPFHKCWQQIGVISLLRWLERELDEAGVRRHAFRLAFANPYPHLYVKVRNMRRT